MIVGMADGHVLLLVAYTERDDRIRIISARRVTQHENDEYFRQKPKKPRSMSSEAIEQAALADHDAKPLTGADFSRMKRTPQAKIIRRALELTQEEFSVR